MIDRPTSNLGAAQAVMRPGWDISTVRARGEITVFTYGSGEPVLLVHGFPDHAVGMFEFAERIASSGYQCIVPVLPGFWLSEAPADRDFSQAAVGSDLIAVLDALTLRRVAYIGHDWGAELGYPLMETMPSRFSSFTALATPHPVGYRIRRTVMHELRTAWYAFFLAYAPNASSVARNPEWLTALMQSWSPGFIWRQWPDVVSTYLHEQVMDSVCGYYRANLDADLVAPVVAMPSLLIHGGQDGCISPNNYVDSDEYFPAGVQDLLLREVGHWPHLEAMDQTVRAVTALLSQVP